MRIRLLKRADVKPAAGIVAKNYNKKDAKIASLELSAMFERKVGSPRYFVAEENKKIVGLTGYIQDWMDFIIYTLFWVNVAPEKQNSGIGRQLITHAIDEIKKKKEARYIVISTKLTDYYRKNWGFERLRALADGYYLMILDLRK